MIGLIVKNEAENICKDKIWPFFNVLALSLLPYVDQFLYLMPLSVTIVYVCYGHTSHLSKKRKNISLNNNFLSPTKTIVIAVV